MEGFSYTRSKIYSIEHTWAIEKFTSLRKMNLLNDLTSNTFIVKKDLPLLLYLKLTPVSDLLRIDLCRTVESQCPTFSCLNKISVLNIAATPGSKNVSQASTSWTSFSYSDIYNGSDTVSPDDTLKIHCEVTLMVKPECGTGLFKVPSLPECNLANDFGTLLNAKEFSDVTIVTGDGTKILAHKTILSARSKVFEAMFKHPMEENRNNSVNIGDLNNKAVYEMLHFIYTGEAPNLKEMTADLLAAAEKYNLDRLKAMCVIDLSVNLSIETAPMTLKLADLYNAEELKAKSIQCIKDNAGSLQETQSWKNTSSTDKKLIRNLIFPDFE